MASGSWSMGPRVEAFEEAAATQALPWPVSGHQITIFWSPHPKHLALAS